MFRNMPLAVAVLFSGGDGVTYLYRDTFDDTLAAGSIDGTPANEGGNRDMNDPSNYVSMGSGLLNFSDGSGSIGDPAYRSPNTFERAVGRLYVVEFTHSDLVGNISYFGIDENTSAAPSDGLVINSNSNIWIGSSGTARVGEALAEDTSYRLIIAMNSTGTQFFLQGGVYTYPTLIWRRDVGTYATFNGAIPNRSGIFTSQYLFITDNFGYLSKPLISDGFSNTFGTTDGLAHVDNDTVLGAGGGSESYVQVGTWQTSSGVANASALSGGVAFAYIAASTTNIFMSVDFTRSGGQGGMVARYADANNYVICYHNGTNFIIDEVVAGVTNNLISAARTYSAGAKMILSIDGQNLRAYYNGVYASNSDVTVNAALTATNHGLYTTDTGNTFDNLVCDARGTGNEHSALAEAVFFLASRQFLVVGDSKSNQPINWIGELQNSLIVPARANYEEITNDFASGGATSVSMASTVTSTLDNYGGDPHFILMNFGANDVANSITESAFKTAMRSMINAFRTKWDGRPIYIAKPGRQNYDSECAAVGGWVDDLIGEYPSGVYAGHDELDWFKGDDNYATYAKVEVPPGVHYNDAGNTECARQWKTILGY